MDMVSINVFSIIGNPICATAEDGEKIFSQIERAFKQGKNVILSFLNMEIMTSAFLNTAVGKLYGKYSTEEIKEKLKVTDISNDNKALLKRVVDTAKIYYSDPKQFNNSIQQGLNILKLK